MNKNDKNNNNRGGMVALIIIFFILGSILFLIGILIKSLYCLGFAAVLWGVASRDWSQI